MIIGRPVHSWQMINKPFSTLPDFIKIVGKDYRINTDFKIWIEISSVLSDKRLPLSQKLCHLLINGFCDSLPECMEEAVSALLGFMNMYEAGSKKHGSAEQVFSFIKDEGLIYAAFRQQYGINLYTEALHWWEFLYLLSALHEDTAFMRIVGYRSVDCSKIKNEEHKRFLRRMKNRYRLAEQLGDSDIAGALTV